MRFRFCIPSAIFLVFVILQLQSDAHASSVEQVIAGFGLFGRWARDCGQPMSVQMPSSFYVLAPDGSVWTQVRAGVNPEFESRSDKKITSAVAVAFDRLSMHWQGTGDSFDIVVLVSEGHSRTEQSIDGNGTVLIKNGTVVKNGTASAWLTKCTSGGELLPH